MHFVREGDKDLAYLDKPLLIGEEQTISQPLTVAFMLELLQPNKGDKVLDIGSGSGWTTALLANIVGKKGYVVGLEIIPSLVKFGRKNLNKLDIKNAEIRKADEKSLGILGKSFDKILVSAAAENIPTDLYDQLNKNGALVIPVKNSIFKITKDNHDNISKKEYHGFMFVPLKYKH